MEGFEYEEWMSKGVADDSPNGGGGTDVATTPFPVSGVADIAAFRTSRPIDIIRWGVIATTTLDAVNATGTRITIMADFRPRLGSTTNQVSGELAGGMGVIDIGASAIPAHTVGDVAAGTGVYTNKVSSAGIHSLTDASLSTKTEVPFELNPGEEIIFNVTDAGDNGGDGYIFVHYVPRGFHDNSLDATKTPTAVGTAVAPNRAGRMSSVENVA